MGNGDNKRGEERLERQDKVLHTCCNQTIPHQSTPSYRLNTMESAINVLVSQFKTFAGKDGSSNTLSKEEFSSLVAFQLPTFVKNASDPVVIEQLMGSLDENNDGELTFLEFWQLIGKLANKQGGF
ncbi:protein S100-A11 [Salmo salar]|uniref:Protein S100-A11 n=3 Tax=Salmo TaxID=8028 RepID=A0A1S3M312_SALSA|nr:protein S100-A11 [Salmo salar]|eukprot:XP_013997598.1 PREDICTED: protein S100-A11-like [Salmo salar]